VALTIKAQTPKALKTRPVARSVDDLLPVGARLTHSDKSRDFGETIFSRGAAISSWTEVQYVRFGQKQTCAVQLGMSAMGHKRTWTVLIRSARWRGIGVRVERLAPGRQCQRSGVDPDCVVHGATPMHRQRDEIILASAEREAKNLYARIKKLDFKLTIGNWTGLPDELVQTLFGHRAAALFVNVNSVRRAWRLSIG
jgi:hypothetical protein